MIKHNAKYILGLKLQNRIFWTLFISAMVGALLYVTQDTVVSPCSDSGCHIKVVEAEERLSDYQKIDRWVDIYSEKYGKTRYQKNRTKAMIHFLLLKEQNYGGSTNCGDSGKACGILQFHEPTYIGYRNIMIKRGLVKVVGSRLNHENAIETCAWAINDGRENAWGPISRGEIDL